MKITNIQQHYAENFYAGFHSDSNTKVQSADRHALTSLREVLTSQHEVSRDSIYILNIKN